MAKVELRSCLTTLTGTLTGTGYRRIAPYPARFLEKAEFCTASHRIPLKESDYEQRRPQVRVLPSAPRKVSSLREGGEEIKDRMPYCKGENPRAAARLEKILSSSIFENCQDASLPSSSCLSSASASALTLPQLSCRILLALFKASSLSACIGAPVYSRPISNFATPAISFPGSSESSSVRSSSDAAPATPMIRCFSKSALASSSEESAFSGRGVVVCPILPSYCTMDTPSTSTPKACATTACPASW